MIRKTELAKELNVSPRTIDNWVRQRRIPVHRFSSCNPSTLLSSNLAVSDLVRSRGRFVASGAKNPGQAIGYASKSTQGLTAG